MKKSLFFLLVLFILASFPLLSQENLLDYEEQEEATEINASPPPFDQEPAVDDDRLYVIDDFEFDIKGQTRPYALMYQCELKKGEELHGRAELEQYIGDKTQMLVNQRVLKDNAEITYSIGEQMENGAYPVTLHIKVEDSWNIIALPYPKYKNDTGFDLSIKARDYNFLGTMSPLRIDLGYKNDENKHNSFSLGVFSQIPFKAFDYDWRVRFNNSFSYRQDVEEPFYYENVTGLSMELPFRKTTFTFGFDETTTLNDENSNRNKEKYGDFQSGMYMSSRLYTEWKIPTGFIVYKYGELTYDMDISARFTHEFPQWPLQDIRYGPSMSFSHSLGFEKIDWHVNYREGLSASIDNSNSLNFYRLRNDMDPFSATISVEGIGHWIISDFLGFSSRLMYRHWFLKDPNYYLEASDAMRGIADKAITADYMLSLNMELPLRILLFTPSKWLDKSKLSFFDVEVHLSPLIDMALYNDPRTGTSFSPKNIAVSGGFELTVFSYFMRSLYVRLGYASNLREFFTTRPFKPPEGSNREIYLIMGHFF